MRLTRLFLFLAIVFSFVVSNRSDLQAGDWPNWRGPSGNNIAEDKNAPTAWSSDKNIKWKVSLPAPGNSTPIVWRDKVFLTGALEKGTRRTLMCFDRNSGKQLWQSELKIGPDEVTHKTNPYCASSPATDGERVVVWHGSAGAAAYDFNGKQLWHTELGKFTHIWGYAASPVIVGELAIFSCGPGLRCFLVALNKRTGAEVWRRELPKAQSKKVGDFYGSWSTPTVIQRAGKKALLLSLPKELRAFDAKSGADLWRCGGLSDLAYTSVIVSGGVAVAMSGYTGPALACRTGGKGDVTESHRLWRHAQKNPQRIGSGVIVGKHIYLLNEPGIAWCFELHSGKVLWKQRVGGRSWCSTALVNGLLYMTNEKGETFVLRPNPEKYELVAKNTLDGEVTRGSLAFSNGQIFVRSYKHLYCIGQ